MSLASLGLFQRSDGLAQSLWSLCRLQPRSSSQFASEDTARPLSWWGRPWVTRPTPFQFPKWEPIGSVSGLRVLRL
jgi:hypothetical protein